MNFELFETQVFNTWFLALELTITLTTELVQPIHATSVFSEFISTQSFQLADC
jgi:hypothetical protein